MADIHYVNRPNPHNLELRKDNIKILGDIKEQVGVVSHLEGRNRLTLKVLGEEAKWIEVASTVQSKEADLPAILENSMDRNRQVVGEMEEQSKVILGLKQYYQDATDHLEQHTAQMISEIDKQAKVIFHLESRNHNLASQNNNLLSQYDELESQYNDQERALFTLAVEKGAAEFERFEQVRVTDSLETRLSKMKAVLNTQAHIMLAELDYQQELIDDLEPTHEEYFQPSHNTMVDMTENLENWTSENNDEGMTFEFETDSQANDEIIHSLERTIDQQTMKIDHLEDKLAQQKKIIFDLKYQKGRLSSELDAQTQRTTQLLEMQSAQRDAEERKAKAQRDEKHEEEARRAENPPGARTKRWLIQQACNVACKEKKEAMKREICNLHRRLRPLEGNLLNLRQLVFCNYLKNIRSITVAEANAMTDSIEQNNVSTAEADAIMVVERMPQYAPQFKDIYGVSPEKILSSGTIKHPYVMRVFNEVGAIRLRNGQLALDSQCHFERFLELWESGQHKVAISACKAMPVRPMRDI